MDTLRVPTVTLEAEILFTDGREYPGRIFVPAAAPRHSGPTRAEEWLNQAAEFFAFLPDDAEAPVMLNKGEVLAVSVHAEANTSDAFDLVGSPERQVEIECAGRKFEGSIVIDNPAGQTRRARPSQSPRALLDGARRRKTPSRPQGEHHPRLREGSLKTPVFTPLMLHSLSAPALDQHRKK